MQKTAKSRSEICDVNILCLFQVSLVRNFLAANLIANEKGYEWRLNLNAIINNISYLTSFPDFVDEQYEGPTLFVGGEKSKYLR